MLATGAFLVTTAVLYQGVRTGLQIMQASASLLNIITLVRRPDRPHHRAVEDCLVRLDLDHKLRLIHALHASTTFASLTTAEVLCWDAIQEIVQQVNACLDATHATLRGHDALWFAAYRATGCETHIVTLDRLCPLLDARVAILLTILSLPYRS